MPSSQRRRFTDKGSGPWLLLGTESMERLVVDWERHVAQRTAALSDLMFKAVAFREARVSLRFGLSLWLLSWITLIFLPLTFWVGVFGMSECTPPRLYQSRLTPTRRRYIRIQPIHQVVVRVSRRYPIRRHSDVVYGQA